MSEHFPAIPTPALVNRYARKLWKVRDLRDGAAGKDLRKRAFQRFQSFPHACTLKFKDSAVAFFTPDIKPRHVAPEIPLQFAKMTKRSFVTMVTIGTKKAMVRRYDVGDPPKKNLVIPYEGTFWYRGHLATHAYCHTKSPLQIIIGEGSASFITNSDTQEKVKHCSRSKPLVIPINHVYSLGKDGPFEAHATLMIYHPHNKTLYYLDPAGWSGLGLYLHKHSADMCEAFRRLFGRTVQKFYDVSLMCPYIPGIQKVEGAKGKDLQGLCVLWSSMLMTQYLEYSKTDPKRDPLKMMETLYDPKNATKHPFVQLNRYLQSLYDEPKSKLTPPPVHAITPSVKPRCKYGYIWELGTCRKPCPKDSIRHEVTKRCRKTVSDVAKKSTSCKPTHELVERRCLKKCQPNQVRNPKTLRCKKA